jgi:hypothetical protein
MPANTYWPGQYVPKSGVYSVVHTNNHAMPHDVTIQGNRDFPSCKECGNRVYFTLAKAGEDIALNPHFRQGAREPLASRP